MVRKKKLKKNQSTHLNIELTSDLFLTIKGIKGFFPSYLIGMNRKAFVIIKSPTIISSEKLMSEGTSLMVRYAHLGDIYRFKATVLGENDDPFKVTYLSYPDVVEKIEYRDSPRVSSYIPAFLTFQKMKVKGIVSDISVAGCKFRTDATDQMDDLLPKKEGDVLMHFPLLGLDGIRLFKGKIKKIEFGNELALGIGFHEIDSDSRNTIRSYVESTQENKDKGMGSP